MTDYRFEKTPRGVVVLARMPSYEDAEDEPPQWLRMEPCVFCMWNYSPARERAGLYRKLEPLTYHPHGSEVCRWCIRRPMVRAAIDNITRAKREIERTLA